MASARAPKTSRALVAEGFAKPIEAARFLGVSKTWIYDLIHAGALTHVRFGRRVSIPWSALHEYAAIRLRHGTIA